MNNMTLAIETSIKAGSLALLNGADVIDGWIGNDDVSRSQDLLPQIKRLLEANQIKLKDLTKIAVSIGPGSFTGIRIGIASAKALALAVNRSIVGVSLLEAMAADSAAGENKKITAVAAAGRGLFFWQSFQNQSALSEAATGDARALEDDLSCREISKIIIEAVAYESYRQIKPAREIETQLIEENFATLIGRKSAVYSGGHSGQTEEVAPLYIRPAVIVKNTLV